MRESYLGSDRGQPRRDTGVGREIEGEHASVGAPDCEDLRFVDVERFGEAVEDGDGLYIY